MYVSSMILSWSDEKNNHIDEDKKSFKIDNFERLTKKLQKRIE